MGESPGAVEARAPVGARPESAMRRPGGASTGGMDSERAVMSGRASAADVVSPLSHHYSQPMFRIRHPRHPRHVCVNLKQDHTVQRRSCRRVPGGARLHDYWQQASKRGAAKEVRFPGFRPDGDGERRADHGGERDESQVVREEGGGGRARRCFSRSLGVVLVVGAVRSDSGLGSSRASGRYGW